MEEAREYKIIKAEDIINGDFSIEDLDVRSYIPFEEKKQIIYAIIDTLLLEDNGIVSFDELDRFVTFIMVAFDSYLKNVDFENKYIECYDALSESGIITEIMSVIGEDLRELNNFFEMECASRLEQNSIENILNRKLNEINLIINTLLGEGITKIGEIGNEIVGKISKEDILKLLNSIEKVSKNINMK